MNSPASDATNFPQCLQTAGFQTNPRWNNPLGIVPLNKFPDRSNCTRLCRDVKLRASTSVGISPDNLFRLRYKLISLFMRKSSPGIVPDSAFKDKSKYSSFEQFDRVTGIGL